MPRSARLLLPLTATALALLPASGASAAKATFTAVFEAERSVAWDQPRGVSVIDCRGENYVMANGGEAASLRTKPFKVTVETFGKVARWTWGDEKKLWKDPSDYGIAAKGQHKRWHERRSGSTGGWCGGGEHPRGESDCGTQLPEFQVTFNAWAGKFSWSANHASWMAREKLGFYKCPLNQPEGMHDHSYPSLEAKYRQADVFNRRKRTITIAASKKYGPTVIGIANLGVDNTSTGSYSYKLVLTRKGK
jgi:hypothetical protein